MMVISVDGEYGVGRKFCKKISVLLVMCPPRSYFCGLYQMYFVVVVL